MCQTTFCSIVLLVVMCNQIAAFPQGWPKQSSFDWKAGKSSQSEGGGDALTGDEDAEMIPSEILEQNQVR